ncbi:MAG: hypothetical protein WCV41_04860 [Patescibacteria group bacterium]
MDNELITKKDLKEILAVELHEVLEAVNQGFNEQTKIIRGIQQEVQENSKEIQENRRELLESNEKIAKEISDMRQEQIAHQGGHFRIDDTLLEHGDALQDHNKRIGQLETSLA